MASSYKLSLPAAILININIMLGAGLFINTLTLSKKTGILSPFVYLIIGLLILPLVLTIAKLLKIHPGGSFYTFGSKEINKTVGFFGIWSFFCAKLASSMLMIHFFSQIVHALFTFLQNYSVFTLDIIILALFTILNMLNLQAGTRIQTLFMILKAIPILFVILSGIFLFTTNNISSTNAIWSGIIPSIPIVIYVFTGFEAACSLSRHIKDPDKNAPNAVLISFGLVLTIVCLFQFFFYILVGPECSKIAEYFQIFPTLVNSVFMNHELLKLKIQVLFQLFIACSALGGAYGILYSNNWNFYTLVENKHTFFPNFFSKLNRFGIPFVCIFVEIFICILYLIVTKGDKIILAQTGALGSTIAYSVSVASLFFASLRSASLRKSIWLPILGAFNCLIFIGMCINGFILYGIFPLLTFIALLIFGMSMFFITNKKL